MNINHGTHKMNERNLLVFVFFDPANKFPPLFLYKSSSSLTFFVSQFSVVTPFRIFGIFSSSPNFLTDATRKRITQAWILLSIPSLARPLASPRLMRFRTSRYVASVFFINIPCFSDILISRVVFRSHHVLVSGNPRIFIVPEHSLTHSHHHHI